MLRHVGWLSGGYFRQVDFDRIGDAGMQFPPLPFQERIVGNVPHQRVLERIGLFVIVLLEPDQPGLQQPGESGFECVAVFARNRRQ